jgi:two-component system chemotaxis sensor kinase CheA
MNQHAHTYGRIKTIIHYVSRIKEAIMPKAFRAGIRLKIAIGYLLIICCMGAAILLVTNRIASLQNEIETMTARDMEITNLITTIRYNVINMETSQRGFLITGNEDYLEPYKTSIMEWEGQFKALQRFIGDSPSKQGELEEIKTTIERWISTTGEPTIEMRRNNQTDAIIQFFQDDPGKRDIEQLRGLLESLRVKHLADNEAYLNDLDVRNTALTTGLYILVTAVAAVALLIVLFVSNSIVQTIKQVVAVIGEISRAKGDLSKRITVQSNDEIRDLANAMNILLDNLEAKGWVQEKVAEVATMNQGMDDLGKLASSFLSKVAPMVSASHGAFYIRRSSGGLDRLEQLASYAGFGEEQGNRSFKLGEGLIGQCAQDKRAFLLNQPEEYEASIQSGLAEFRAKSVLVVPVEFQGHAIAVIEFASLEPFTTQHLQLLEAIEDHLGVAIDNAAGRMEVERLLGESQALTEELQAQTEELQAQSEELQMQQEEMRITTEHLEEQNLFAEQKTKELEYAKAELEQYAERLKQSAQYKTNFLANMSHELRTPLNSILILSQLLYENGNGSLTSEEEGYARVIHSSGNDLLTLIDDILDLSKIEAGKVSIVLDEVNVTEIPDLMKLSFEPVAEKKGVLFQHEMQPDVPQIIRTDGQRLQQILKNLLSNAFKFTDSGSVTLKIHKADPIVARHRLPNADPDRIVAFSIIDTGIGIPKDKQELIFEAFQQVDGNTNRIYGGTGLGLSICSEFARLLHGCIVVDSELHKGSSFTLYMPVDYEAAVMEVEQSVQESAASRDNLHTGVPAASDTLPLRETAQPALAGESESGDSKHNPFPGKRVLLVEDDARNVFAIIQALEQRGLEVAVASNGKECMEMVDADSRFDLILMDIMMPIMDGFETTRALRRHPLMKNTPIIALTAKAMRSDMESCLEAGASDYISKPIQMEQLFSLMRVWLTKQVDQ